MSSVMDEIQLIQVIERGQPGSGITNAEHTALRSDVTTLLGRPAITSLGAVPDVTITSPATGHIIVRDASGTWVNRAPAPAITVTDSSSVDLTLTGSDLTAAVIFSGSGSSPAAARADHEHRLPSFPKTDFAATGNISSGTRALASVNQTLVSGVTYRVLADVELTVRGGGSGSSFYVLRVEINGVGSGSTQLQAVAGVPRHTSHDFQPLPITGDGTAITANASISYDGGDPTDVRSGRIRLRAYPAR